MASNLTRREFLKEMGFLGVGIGLIPEVTSLGPVEAFGEQWSDKTEFSRPAWVKEVDKPTMEIDWEQMQRYDEGNTCRGGLVKYVGEDTIKQWGDTQAATLKKNLEDNVPGYSLRDRAISDAIGRRLSGEGAATMSFLGPQAVPTPADRGVPAWEGTPEDNALMIRAALRHFGAATVGFVELDPATTQKLIYAHDPDGKELVFSDVDTPDETDTQRIIPNKAQWVIVWTVQMSQETLRRAPTPLGAMTTTLTYERNLHIQNRMQGFLRGIGYMGLGEASINALGIAPALGVMAGLGEESRLNRLITPEYGPMVRVFKVITDLPLAPTKPIDTGIMEFCKYCKTCATYCPSGALSLDPEPTWEVQGGWNNPGHKAYFEDSTKCRQYWAEIGTNCGICFSVCPFSEKNQAAVHQLVQATISTTPLFDGAFANMGRFAYLTQPPAEAQKDPNEWWTLDYGEYGIDTVRGHKDA